MSPLLTSLYRVRLHPRGRLVRHVPAQQIAERASPRGHKGYREIRDGIDCDNRGAGIRSTASANTTYETKSDELEELTASIVLLDPTLAQYGRGANTARNLLRLAQSLIGDCS
jgi:hypothetical protein